MLTQTVSALYHCHRRTETTKINNGISKNENAENFKDKSTELTSSQLPQKILHRDLKPGNIFLDSNSDCKLGDFGLVSLRGLDSDLGLSSDALNWKFLSTCKHRGSYGFLGVVFASPFELFSTFSASY